MPHLKCQINILWVCSDSGPHALSVQKCVYVMKGFIKAYLKLKEPILKTVCPRVCLWGYRVRTSSPFSNPPGARSPQERGAPRSAEPEPYVEGGFHTRVHRGSWRAQNVWSHQRIWGQLTAVLKPFIVSQVRHFKPFVWINCEESCGNK